MLFSSVWIMQFDHSLEVILTGLVPEVACPHHVSSLCETELEKLEIIGLNTMIQLLIEFLFLIEILSAALGPT